MPGREAPPGTTVGPVEGRKGGLGGAGGPGVITASQPGEGDEIHVPDSLVLNSGAVDLAKAEARLDRLEGAISLDWGDKDVCWMFDEEVGIDAKVHRTLKDNVAFWQESGASQFALSVIQNGYIPDSSEDIGHYEEKNNKSYKE